MMHGGPSRATSRCVVTGVGVLSPIGSGYEAFTTALRGGVCGVRPFSGDPNDATVVELEVAGEVEDLSSWLPAGSEWLGRSSALALAAAHQAVDHAGIDFAALEPCHGLLLLASTLGPCDMIEEVSQAADTPLDRRAQQLVHHALNAIVDELGFSGEAAQLTHGCSAANYALTYAKDAIARGRHEVALVGGVDTFAQVCLIAYDRFGILASRSLPFDAGCEGMVVGEGAGFMVLESEARARHRGAEILAEIAGGATTLDAQQILSPSPEGQALHRSMLAALDDAGLTPSDVDYISAGAPGTPVGDRAEARAIKRLFEACGAVPPVSATKSQTANCHGASAMLEAIACVAAIEGGFLPPTIGLRQPNEVCTFDLVAGSAREQPVAVALNNATGFGGADSSVVIRALSRAGAPVSSDAGLSRAGAPSERPKR